MQRCPDSTAQEVAALRADGIEPTLDELAAMMHWGALVECPAGRVGPQPEDAPIEVGDRVLWPLTLAADAWLDMARDWLSPDLLPAAFGLAAERAREPGAFASLYSRRAAVEAVTEWQRTFTATPGELHRALWRLIPEARPTDQEPEDDGEPPPILPPQFDLAELVAGTGLPIEYWQAHTSRHCLAVMDALAARAAAETGAKLDRDPSREAYRQLLCLVGQIRRRAACPTKS